MRTLFLLGTAREASTRLRKKMVRPFAGTTLFDIYMKKFEALAASTLFCDVGMAVPTSDKELWAIAEKYDVPMIRETPRENPAPMARNKELYYLEDIDASHILWLNGCLPMLRAQTIHDMGARFLSHPNYHSLEPVVCRVNWFWDWGTDQPLNHHGTSLQHTDPVGESCQALHIFNREVMLRTGQYFEGGRPYDPYLYKLEDRPELADIDTAQEFQRVEAAFEQCDQADLYCGNADHSS